MQDAERLQEQIDEMITKAEVRAEVAQAHHETIVKQRHVANRDLLKFKFLQDIFTLGQTNLNQRRENLTKAQEPPESYVIEGLDAALEELGRILRQAQDAMHRCDGSQAALKRLEEVFHDEKIQATSRARGLAVQGQRAVDVAAGRIETLDPSPPEVAPTPELAPVAERPLVSGGDKVRKVPDLISSIQKKQQDENPAKEPIASP